MKADIRLIGLIIFGLGLVLIIGTDFGTRQMLALGMMGLGAIVLVSERFWNRARRK